MLIEVDCTVLLFIAGKKAALVLFAVRTIGMRENKNLIVITIATLSLV